MNAQTKSPARVFVVQDSRYRDRETGLYTSKYDLRPAEKFGRLVTIMGGGKVIPERAAQAMRQIREVLKTFGENDFILVIGDPAAIAGACMVASAVNAGRVKLLRWDRASGAYEIVQLEMEAVS